MKSMPSAKARSTHATARSRSTAPPYVIHEPSEISETTRSLAPSCLRFMVSTVTASVRSMPKLDAIGIVSADLDRTRAFYALLGAEIADGDDHVEATTPSGIRRMFDTEDVRRSFRP